MQERDLTLIEQKFLAAYRQRKLHRFRDILAYVHILRKCQSKMTLSRQNQVDRRKNLL